MTGNQIAYWNLQETKRSNLINEGIKDDTLNETKRSNLVQEGIKKDTLAETKRSNLINEAIKDKDVNSQIERRTVQNVTDSVKTTTGGFKDVMSGLFGKRGLFG